MRVVTFGILSIFTVLCFSSIISADEKQYVEVKAPFANVYKELDPKSEIIEQAKKVIIWNWSSKAPHGTM